MPLAVSCPACGSKLNAPDSLAGKRIKCPRCGGRVEVTPARPPRDHLVTGPPPRRAAIADQESEPDEDNATYVAARRRADPDDPTPAHKGANSLGISSLVLGILALLFAWIPLVGMVSIPLGGLGLLLGIAGGVVALLRRGSGVGFPIAGAAVSLLAIGVAVAWLGFIGRAVQAVGEEVRAKNATNQKMFTASDPSPGASPEAPPDSQAAQQAEWVDVTKGAAQQGDVRIWVPTVMVGDVPLRHLGHSSISESKYLMIRLRIENASETRKIGYESWAANGRRLLQKHVPHLTDNFGNTYKPVTFGLTTEVEGQLEAESIYPGKYIDDLLVYEPPIDKAEYLRLELPASAFGGTGMIRLQMPTILRR
jgi:hypothetical protein